MTIDIPLLAIDVGRGTQDVLVYAPGRPIENSTRCILPSPTVVVAEQIRRARGAGLPVFLEGYLMGGGANVAAIREHLDAGLQVTATEEATATIHDDPARVRAMGVRIADRAPPGAAQIHTTDYMERELRTALDLFAVEYPAALAAAVQDHGFSPHRSNRIRRFEMIEERLDAGDWNLYSLIADPPPLEMTRMQAMRRQAPGALVIDTGPAALIGALCDPRVKAWAEKGIVLVNAGNGHTLCCTIQGEEICGIFEHHTGALDRERLQRHIGRLRDGSLTGKNIFDEGGHGAAVRRPLSGEGVVATGPNRRRLLPDAYQAAAFGDMMLTGCFGLLQAWNRVRGI
ncbi:MAG: DUF1786 domain-containing protein [Methanomicrobiaceae archaeon]|nr:DUF1786 domain-containing protein [Methanomicrobiaceae archaeon]